MKNTYTTEDQLKINGKVYDVDAFAKDEDGVGLVLVSGWGSREAYYNAEVQEGLRDGSIEILEQ